MTKLTNATRETIRKAALKDAFSKRLDEWHTSVTVFAATLVKSHVSAEVLAQATGLMKDYVRPVGTVSIEAPGWAWVRQAYADRLSCLEEEALPSQKVEVPFSFPTKELYQSWDRIAPKEPLHVQEAARLSAQWVEMREQLQDLKANLRSILWSVQTLEKLEAIWPEGKPYFPPIASPVRALIPTSSILAVNKVLGLPKDAVKVVAKAKTKAV